MAFLREVLLKQTRLLDAVIHQCHAGSDGLFDKNKRVFSVTLIMMQSLGVSVHSVLKLTSEMDMAIRDCFGIARSAAELAVNICYIAVGGEEVAKRANRHAMQKSYRDLDRSGEIGGIQFKLSTQDRPSVESVPGLAEALADFTGSKGNELADWTPLNISARIDVIRQVDDRSALALSSATISIYRHASEFLHGTYFSVIHFWRGPGQEKLSKKAFSKRWEEHFTCIFCALYFSVAAVVELFAARYALPEIGYASRQLSKMVQTAMEQTATSVETAAAHEC